MGCHTANNACSALSFSINAALDVSFLANDTDDFFTSVAAILLPETGVNVVSAFDESLDEFKIEAVVSVLFPLFCAFSFALKTLLASKIFLAIYVLSNISQNSNFAVACNNLRTRSGLSTPGNSTKILPERSSNEILACDTPNLSIRAEIIL
ncbi:MAG: hypothetical protein RL708_1854 [Bacteroidota bacterium]